MASVIIENPQTGETRTLEKDASGRYPTFHLPWRVKGTVEGIKQAAVQANAQMLLQSKIAVYAQRMGLPAAGFLDAARWLLDRDCPYCQLATEALRRIQELGDEMAIYFLNRIQVAKMNNDMAELRRIRQEISAALRGEPVAINDKR